MGSDIIQFLKAKAYRKIRDLGHGATGQTVLLHDDSIDEDFVCKKYVPYYDYYKEECYKRFVDEIKILYKMNHPRIVRVFNYYLYPDQWTGYILMELILSNSCHQTLIPLMICSSRPLMALRIWNPRTYCTGIFGQPIY